ncbi:MAG TPA: hypothetical protein VGJ29_09780 [Vicinamibacterales bacterium]
MDKDDRLYRLALAREAERARAFGREVRERARTVVRSARDARVRSDEARRRASTRTHSTGARPPVIR